MTSRPRTVLAMQPQLPEQLFGADYRHRLQEVVTLGHNDVLTEYGSPAARAALADAEVLLTCWGAPTVDGAALAAAPQLKAIVHAAGTIKTLVAAECWQRGIVVSSGADANAVPVAEYTVSMILLAGKRVLAAAQSFQTDRARPPKPSDAATGNYQRTVGLLSASRVGRRVATLLAPFDLDVLIADPFLDDAGAAALGATLVGLDELCARSEILSLHAPSIPATRHMIGGPQLAALPDAATLINTARGSILDHDALLAEVCSGRLNAVLDVTDPEPLPADSPLWTLPNVLLTPHVAGAQGVEIRRLGASAMAELRRYGRGEPLQQEIRAAELDITA